MHDDLQEYLDEQDRQSRTRELAVENEVEEIRAQLRPFIVSRTILTLGDLAEIVHYLTGEPSKVAEKNGLMRRILGSNRLEKRQ